MKKRIVCMLMATMMVLSLAACSKQGAQDGTTAANAATTGADATGDSTNAADGYEVEEYDKYVTLGDYKSMEVVVNRSSLEVTEDEIQAEVDAVLDGYATQNQITEGVVEDGNKINLDFSGLLDGVAFSGGTATDVEYTVGGDGYSKYIDDLDRGLIGLEIGKEYEIPCTFPADYGNEELNGKDVIFVVTVNYIIEDVYPEFNDELVKQVAADMGTDISTTAEMLADIERYLEESKRTSFNQQKYTMVMSELLETTQFSGMPQSEYEYLQATVRANIQNEFEMYGSYYGATDVESFYSGSMAGVYGYDTLDEFVVGYTEEFLKEKMIVTQIAKAEGLTVTDEEVKAYGEEVAAANGYESYDAILAEYGDTIIEEFRYTLMSEKVIEYFAENIKEAAAETEAEAENETAAVSE